MFYIFSIGHHCDTTEANGTIDITPKYISIHVI